jgi:mRNA-degrading endonuclease RelE of RelBE toxin-antitoxin system
MKTRVRVRQQVHDFIAALAPVPRRRTWAAVKELAPGKGDLIQLEGGLAPFFRLRTGKIRVVFEEKSVAGERVLLCFFADRRATVYEALAQLIANDLLGELGD